MSIYIPQDQITGVVAALKNTQQASESLRVATQIRIEEIMEALAQKGMRFEKYRQELLEQHVAKNGDGYQTEQTPQGEKYVFKSEADKEEFIQTVSEPKKFDVTPLTARDLEDLRTADDDFGSARQHYTNLKLVTEQFATTTLNKNEED